MSMNGFWSRIVDVFWEWWRGYVDSEDIVGLSALPTFAVLESIAHLSRTILITSPGQIPTSFKPSVSPKARRS